MTREQMARKAAEINFEVVVVHGVEPKVGFEWRDAFIHNPFADPQYGAFAVDPVAQYGGAYLNSVFATDPEKALEMARRQLRETASADIARYRAEGRLGAHDIAAAVENACGVAVAESGDPLESLTDEQVAQVWSRVERIATDKAA